MTDAALPAVIEQLLKPEFYPHPVTLPIRLIQTHISYVALTGDYAYKVKKPLNFGFLDFTTLDKRQHFCQEELRMNQQGAPGIYLQVLAISQQGKQFAWNDQAPVEYALKMRQFPQDRLFSQLFERGELTEALMMELGQVVAQFHAKTLTNDRIRSFGQVSSVRAAFDENYEQTAGYIGGPQTQQQFDETQAYTDRFFAENGDLFQQRIQQDRIRECHGDLHLNNICLWQDRILLFDCIEFNEPFRFVDVMYDVAYAVMDLDSRHRTDLGNAYLNTYLEETGDWEGLQVLPIYLNRQTYVRAKVGSFLLDDPTASAEAKAQAAKTAASYYRLAWEYTLPRKGRLIVMSGLSGSGKSTVAKTLARQLNGIQIRSDAVRKHLGGISIHERGGSELYSPEMTEKTYTRLLDLGIRLARSGYTVILDAKYDQQVHRSAVIASAQAASIPLQIIFCTAPLAVITERLHQRTGDIADATVELLSSQQATLQPFGSEEQPFLVTLDTSLNWQAQVAELSV